MVQKGDGGASNIENAIPVCFECHAEIHSYNDRHPRGRKFRAEELKRHKEQWLDICKDKPEVFKEAARDYDVGPLQALIDELEFNAHVSNHSQPADVGCLFLDDQFRRATQSGAISTLEERLKELILEAYRAMSRANQIIPNAIARGAGQLSYSEHMGRARESISNAKPKILAARNAILRFLGSEV